MQKIISLFQRNYDGDRLVRDEVVPGAEWVLAGEGAATRKWDGTCCRIKDGRLWKRYDAKQAPTIPAVPGQSLPVLKGGPKAPPDGFEPAQDPDPVTGHWPGWVPVGDGPEDARHREAAARYTVLPPEGTYELVGPKVNGNPERMPLHSLVRHGLDQLPDVPRSFDALRSYLAERGIEGVVWHHPDGRMVKIKAKDFGLPWPPKEHVNG